MQKTKSFRGISTNPGEGGSGGSRIRKWRCGSWFPFFILFQTNYALFSDSMFVFKAVISWTCHEKGALIYRTFGAWWRLNGSAKPFDWKDFLRSSWYDRMFSMLDPSGLRIMAISGMPQQFEKLPALVMYSETKHLCRFRKMFWIWMFISMIEQHYTKPRNGYFCDIFLWIQAWQTATSPFPPPVHWLMHSKWRCSQTWVLTTKRAEVSRPKFIKPLYIVVLPNNNSGFEPFMQVKTHLPTNLYTHIYNMHLLIYDIKQYIYIYTYLYFINSKYTYKHIQQKQSLHPHCSLCFQLTWTFGRSGSSSASSSSSKGEALAIRDAWGVNWVRQVEVDTCQNITLTSASLDHTHIPQPSPWKKHSESAITTSLELSYYFFHLSYSSTLL